MNIKEFIKNHFDCNLYTITIPAIICLLAITPCALYLPESWGFENGIIENIQLIILLTAFIFSIKAKSNKKLLIFIALIILLMTLREINYGRIFFPIPNKENMFYSWKDIKYGYLVHPIIAVYIIGSAVYFIVNKLHREFWHVMTKLKLPIINFLLLFIGIITAYCAEKYGHNLVMIQDLTTGLISEKYTQCFVLEEMAELLSYLAILSIVYIYAFKYQDKSE
jgi:hypothetical protein